MIEFEIPAEPNERWEWIKYQLRCRKTSLAKLARDLKVSGTAVKNAKRTAYPRMERAIAKALDLKPIQLWPERWGVDGTPLRQRPNRAEINSSNAIEHTSGYVIGHFKTGRETLEGEAHLLTQAVNSVAANATRRAVGHVHA